MMVVGGCHRALVGLWRKNWLVQRGPSEGEVLHVSVGVARACCPGVVCAESATRTVQNNPSPNN